MRTLRKEIMAIAIAAKDVAALRAKTGAGMMECKKALTETGGDIEKAIDLLRAKGITRAEKRAGRGASEGVIGSYASDDGTVCALVEVNCETDFVARTDEFKELAAQLAVHVVDSNPGSAAEAREQEFAGGGSVADHVKAAGARLGENVVLNGVARIEIAVDSGSSGNLSPTR